MKKDNTHFWVFSRPLFGPFSGRLVNRHFISRRCVFPWPSKVERASLVRKQYPGSFLSSAQPTRAFETLSSLNLTQTNSEIDSALSKSLSPSFTHSLQWRTIQISSERGKKEKETFFPPLSPSKVFFRISDHLLLGAEFLSLPPFLLLFFLPFAASVAS